MRITTRRRARLASAALAAAGLTMIASPALAATAAPQYLVPYGQLTCGAGPIEPGTYISILVTGNCWLTNFGTVVINGDLRVAHDAKFDGTTSGTLIVDGNFFSGTNSVTDMGTAGSNDVIMGDVYADNAYEMAWNNVTVGGWYDVVAQDHYTDNTDCSQTDMNGTPDGFSFVQGSVGGFFNYQDNRTCTMNLLNSHVTGTVSVNGNLTNVTVPGIGYRSPQIAGNSIGGALNCTNNKPAPTLDHGRANTAARGKHGQCAHM
jgi:hypothetical protein